MWILIALISSNLLTTQFKTEEECLGRKAIVDRDFKINSKCVELNTITSSGTFVCTTYNCIAK